MEERSREEQIGAQAGVELGRLPAERGDADRVLQEAAGVRMVAVDGGGERPLPSSESLVGGEASGKGTQARISDLGGEEVEEAVQLVQVAASSGDELRRIGRGRLERADLELEPVPKPLHASEDANGVAFAEPLVEQVDVAPDTSLDASARVHELEREVGAPRARAQAPLAGDRVKPLHDPIFGQLGDGRGDAHRPESRPEDGW